MPVLLMFILQSLLAEGLPLVEELLVATKSQRRAWIYKKVPGDTYDAWAVNVVEFSLTGLLWTAKLLILSRAGAAKAMETVKAKLPPKA